MIHIISPFICRTLLGYSEPDGPTKGFRAVSIFIFIFYRSRQERADESLRRHEKTHFYQQLELLFIFQWLLYLYFNITRGYRNNPFEYEDREQEFNSEKRKMYGWIKFI